MSEIKNFFDREWSSLYSIGHSKLVQSSLIWVFIVPIAAKILHEIDSIVYLEVFSYTFKLNLELPFSWVTLYFSALFFAMGSLLYIFFCPKLIKDYLNYSSFVDKDNSYELLVSKFHYDATDSDHEAALEYIDNLLSEMQIEKPQKKTKFSPRQYVRKIISLDYRINLIFISKNEYCIPNIFYYFRECLEFYYTRMRVLCFISYLVGFLLLSFIFIENLVYVIAKI